MAVHLSSGEVSLIVLNPLPRDSLGFLWVKVAHCWLELIATFICKFAEHEVLKEKMHLPQVDLCSR